MTGGECPADRYPGVACRGTLEQVDRSVDGRIVWWCCDRCGRYLSRRVESDGGQERLL